MSLYNDVITLVSPAGSHQDAAGRWHYGEPQKTEVFCNRFSLSLAQNAAALDMGLRDTIQFQVRTVDYSGQDRAIYEGTEYEVSYVSVHGDKTTITVGHKIGDQ